MEKHEILLELTLYRDGEVNKRNDIIDNKIKSMIAFIVVMLTIEFTTMPHILNTINKTSLNSKRLLLLLGIALNCCYSLATVIMVDYSKRLTKEMKIITKKKIKQMKLNFA